MKHHRQGVEQAVHGVFLLLGLVTVGRAIGEAMAVSGEMSYASEGLQKEALFSIALVLFLIVYILWEGLPHLTWTLLTTAPSYLQGTVGILPDILNTLYVVLCTLVIVLPIGVGRRSIWRSTPPTKNWWPSSSTPPRLCPASPPSFTALWA